MVILILMAPRIRRRITSSRRDEIEKEQDVLSRAIVRPFDVVANLPVSFNPPPNGQYETIIKTPLTIKDSAVFYRSLMKSRYNYVHMCPMFELYWVKQSSYARKLVEQDRPLPKSMKDEAFGDREPVLGSEFSARDVMVKLCDASISLGPHEFAIRLFIAKDDRSEKVSKTKETKHPGIGKKKASGTEENHANNVPTSSQTSASATKPLPGQAPENPTPNSAAPQTAHNADISPAGTNQSSDAVQNHDSQPSEKTNNDSNAQSPEKEKASASPTSLQTPPTVPTKHVAVPQSSTPAPPPPAPPAPADPNNMQSIENTIMISNLNAIARTDDSLNKLMKIVALGSASPLQISTFQGFIKQAREMGPQAHHSYLFNPINHGEDRTSKQPKEKKTFKERKPKDKKEKLPKDQKLTAFQEKYYVGATILFEFVESSNVRFKIPQNAIMEVLERTEEQTQNEGTEAETRDILVSFMWIHNHREMMEYKEKLRKYDEKIAEAQVTKSDENDVESKLQVPPTSNEDSGKAPAVTIGDKAAGTDGVDSPQSIQPEGLSDNAAESESKASPDPDASTPTKIGSQAGTPQENHIGLAKSGEPEVVVGDVTSAAALAETEDAFEAPDAVPGTQHSATDMTTTPGTPLSTPVVSRSTRSRNYTSHSKKAPSKCATSKKLERPTEPEARFTSVSCTLRGIPHRFVPIILNSAEPQDTVCKSMTHLIENGFRLPHFYLWYQIDGRLDEALGDSIRLELIAEEKKMTGISTVSIEKPTLAQQAEKKRKNKEKADERAKRSKLATANGREIAAEPMVKSENVTVGASAT